MKKTIAGLFAIFALTTGHTQTPAENETPTPVSGYTAYNTPVKSISTHGIEAKAVRNLYKTYGDYNNESWYNTNYGFRAKFKQGGKEFIADYNKKGGWIRTIKTYEQDKLPKELRERVRQTYYDHNITLVQEVNENKQVIYLVSIADNTSWMILRLEGDDMDTIASYQKK